MDGRRRDRADEWRYVIYSGHKHENAKHGHGVAILMGKKAKRTSPRIIYARPGTRYYNLFILNIYTPTN